MAKTKVTVAIITRNEQHNIEECLKSVYEWADEIIVVDDQSTDETINIAKRFTDKIFQRKMDNEGTHRNWTYAQSTNDWVFSLDADERATDELKEEITQTLQSPLFEAYTIPRRNYVGDFWMKHGGQYPAAQLRLFLKDKFRYEEAEVHPRAFLDGKTGHLTKDVIHKSYRDFGHFLIKLNGQTTLEAKKWIKDQRKMSFGVVIRKSLHRFFRAYIQKKGYKDGFVGFMSAYFATMYQIITYAKYWEAKEKLKS